MAAVVSRAKHGEELGMEYDVFVYSIASAEFAHLTGVRAVHNPLERVYMGISSAAGNNIAMLINGQGVSAVDLRDIDRSVVLPLFP